MRSIPLFKVFISEDVLKPVCEVLMSGFVGQGVKVDEFELKLQNYLGNKFVLTTNSGTSANHLALHLLGQPFDSWPGMSLGDEVLATPLTCTATNWPIVANGYNIKWVDIDPKTCNLDLADLESKLSRKTKIISLVHWGGNPVDLDRVKIIQDISFEKYGFRPIVIEDCAHAFGAKYKGENLGNHGNLAFYSFQAIKHFTAVDGGLICLPNSDLYKRAKLGRWYGIDRESDRKDFRCEEDIPEWGFKFHMNDVNATIGIHNLPHIRGIVDRHHSNANFFQKNLREIPGVTLLSRPAENYSADWIYTIRAERRDDLIKKLAGMGVASSRVHERNDKHTCVAPYAADLPGLDLISKDMLCIPNGWWLSEEDRDFILKCIKEGW